MDYPTSGGYEFNTFTTTAVTLTATTSGTLLAARANRIYARITNPNTALRTRMSVWLGESAYKTSGIFVDRGESWETNRNNLWRGSITGINNTATAVKVIVTEGYTA